MTLPQQAALKSKAGSLKARPLDIVVSGRVDSTRLETQTVVGLRGLSLRDKRSCSASYFGLRNLMLSMMWPSGPL
jgi:hypothetical protein